MYRNFIIEAIVLKTQRMGECHKVVTFLTKSKGIITGIAHGAKKIKSALRSATEPLNLCKVYFYHNPVKNSYKISDIDCIESFDEIPCNLSHFYTASLWIEIILKSFGGGDVNSSIFDLFVKSLYLLSKEHKTRLNYMHNIVSISKEVRKYEYTHKHPKKTVSKM